MNYLANAFSLNMLSISPDEEVILKVKKIPIEEVKKLVKNFEFESCIGHLSTAVVLSKLLEKQIDVKRVPIKVTKNDKIIVFQILTRLEEGKILTNEEITKIPYEFFIVEVA